MGWAVKLLATIFLAFMFSLITDSVLEIERFSLVSFSLYMGYVISLQVLFGIYKNKKEIH